MVGVAGIEPATSCSQDGHSFSLQQPRVKTAGLRIPHPAPWLYVAIQRHTPDSYTTVAVTESPPLAWSILTLTWSAMATGSHTSLVPS